ncbi:hypothetical protein [Streptomyces avicenniae]|uniref:hypothetical protein n=1 Tax=Streptomyces avicenniae TaxID=500153 RepID=UPI000699C3CB|nr:hypothetical protein [Streptomyces avicenniae]
MATDVPGDPADPTADGRGQRVLDLLDKAIEVQNGLVRRNIARARQRNPDATPAQVVRGLERMYIGAMTGTGAAVGGTAAVPGIGTGVALALSAGEAFSSLEMSALFTLSVADVHGVHPDEIERRRTLVMGVMLGGTGSATIARVAERTGQDWGRQVVTKAPVTTLRRVNRALAKHFIRKYGTKQGIVLLGRAAPFGIGAVIGGTANAAIARGTVQAGRRAFGPPPESWPWEAHDAPAPSADLPGGA